MKQKSKGPDRIVGFDIDGVLTDEFAAGENIWQREVEAHFPGLELVQDSFAFTTAYGLSITEVEEFMGARAPLIFSQVPPQAEARGFLQWLRDMDFTVHLITARQDCYKEVTARWLQNHNLPYHGLWFQEDKGVLCHALGIELFVDDYWENCVAMRDYGIVSLLMSAHHNQPYRAGDGIYRVDSWREIEAYIVEYYGLQSDWVAEFGA